MGAHARPKKSRRTGVLVATAGMVGMAAPVAVSGVASAASPTHPADQQSGQDTESDTAQQGGGKHAAPGPAKDLATSGWGKSGRHAAPAADNQPAVKSASTTASSDSATAGPSNLHTKHAFLSDSTQGKELWSGSQADTAVPMGSITKVMTAEVVAKHHSADLDRLVTVKQEYRDYVQQHGASTADLKTGDKLTVRQLLSAALVPSGCDAAYALADTLGEGDTAKERVASFVDQMNSDAQELGMTSTSFDTPTGVSPTDTDNHSTASDLTKLGTAVLKHKPIADAVGQSSAREVATNGREYTWDNTDKLLTQYDGAIGIKTGSGPNDGYCLLFAAQRDGRTLVGAVLQDTEARFKDAKSMLDWGFQQGS